MPNPQDPQRFARQAAQAQLEHDLHNFYGYSTIEVYVLMYNLYKLLHELDSNIPASQASQ